MPKMTDEPKLVNRGGAGLLKKVTNGDEGLPPLPDALFPPDSIFCEGQVVGIDDVHADPDNAKVHTPRNMHGIKGSFLLHGQRRPLVVRKENMRIACGNGSWQAMKDLGWTKCAVDVQSMTDVQFAGFAVDDNRSSENALWNFEMVKRVEALRASTGSGIPMPGWSTAEVLALRKFGQKAHTDPDRIPPAPKEPVTKLGDLWLLGDHRLLCGDSSKKGDVEILMDGHKAVLMVTDPPYGVGFVGQKFNPRAKGWVGIYGDMRSSPAAWTDIEGDDKQGSSLKEFLVQTLQSWLPHTESYTSFYLWAAPLAEGAVSASAIREVGLHIQGQIIWAKNGLVLGQSDYQWKHENCWYAFFKGKQHRWYGGRDKTTLWEIKQLPKCSYLHPMQKPVDLYKIPMENHTTAGEVCAEPFSGSGTQIIAGEEMGRVVYAMELDPVYCDVAKIRWEQMTGKTAVLVRAE